jgi:uncharacterized protein
MQPVRKVPLRKCVGCQEMFPKRELLRVVLTPEGTLTVDSKGKMNGRGAYLCGNLDCFRLARKRKALERALKVSIPEVLYEEVEQRMQGAEYHGGQSGSGVPS